MKTIKEWRTWLEQEKGKQSVIRQKLTEQEKTSIELESSAEYHEKAKIIVRAVGLAMQQKLQYHISEIASLALDSVFEEPYELKVNFVERRGKIECDLAFERDGEHIDPLDGSGGGAVDVAAFALRIACWSLQSDKLDNVMILDEPFHFLDEVRQPKASAMIKELSQRLGIQFLIVTHDIPLTECADKVFMVTKNKGISKIK